MTQIRRLGSFCGVILVALICYAGNNEVSAKPKPCFFDWYGDWYDYGSDDYYNDSDEKPKPTPQAPVPQTQQQQIQPKPGQQLVVETVATTPKPGATTTTAKPTTTTEAAKTTAKEGSTAKPESTTAAATTTTKKA